MYIFALAAEGEGISGSDRIFIEFARHWSKRIPISIYVWEEGYQMCRRQKLDEVNIKYRLSNMVKWKNFGALFNYSARIIEGVRIALSMTLVNGPSIIIYSASEFWMDSLPAFLLKLRYPKIKWIACWYQTAPNPLVGFKKDSSYSGRVLIYWLVQFPIKLIIDKFADFVLVNNNDEKKQFSYLKKLDKTIVVSGAVNLKEIKKWRSKNGDLSKIYSGVFQGRLHPQKGVLELVDIWKKVVSREKDAKLVMIGDGPLRANVELRIKNLGLERNIILTGYLFDGEEKYKLFASSKIVVHPSVYDSGGMASLEAMVFGLPCVGFNLPAYKYYYPQGMIKAEVGNTDDFANKILQLLLNKKLYEKIKKEAVELISDKLSWEYRSRQILARVLE